MAVKGKSPKKRRKIGKHYYNLVSCTGAKTKAKKARKAGNMAQVVNGCYYKGPKHKGARR